MVIVENKANGQIDSHYRTELEAIIPGRSLRTVIKDDNIDLPDGPCKAVYVGTQGNLAVIAVDDTVSVVLIAVSGWIPITARRILSTGTTADGIVAVY